MKQEINKNTNWTTCPTCQGRGKKRRRVRKKARLQYQQELEQFEKSNKKETAPIQPKGALYPCENCNGSGLNSSNQPTVADTENYPHLAIIGGGIGGTALAIACLHRGIPFTLYERDHSFDARAQGYGLTLQQASRAMAGLGLPYLKEGVVSTRHLMHTTEGKVLGEWGMRKWLKKENNKHGQKSNIHIARQALRMELLEQLGGHDKVQWGHQLIDFQETNAQSVELSFKVDGKTIKTKTDLLIGADGIRSSVRNVLFKEKNAPLNYLDCIVILGICPLENLKGLKNPLIDGATIFQTANGIERIYMMPFTKDAIMWQLSFPMPENDANALSKKGPSALKAEAIRRCPWHKPIPEILNATNATQVSGYPVYDRAVLRPSEIAQAGMVTLLGDAAHPMSPFKGQGANQALLDALALARSITNNCRPLSNWRKQGIRKSVLNEFEAEMLERTSIKVQDSAAAATFLHSELVLLPGDQPRGSILKNKK